MEHSSGGTTSLMPETVLQRVPEFGMRVFSNGHVELTYADVSITTDHHTFAVLDAFARPTSFEAAVRQLRDRVRTPQEWIEMTSTIIHLFEGGILRDAERAAPVLRSGTGGFDAAWIHILMLNDRARTEAYISALNEMVKPGDVVVDIGTGTGVLALAAARAGARHVYAIEASSIGRAAQEVFRANGLGDRITLVPGWSTQVDLPEPADLLVSEIIGNEPLGEQVLEVTSDALERLMKPDARLVPGSVSIYGLPVAVPEDVVAQYQFTETSVRTWKDWYGLSFDPLARIASSSGSFQFFAKPANARHWPALGAPVLLTTIDLGTVRAPQVDTTARAEATDGGRLNGLLIYFELALSPGVVLSTHPATAGDTCSWRNAVWLIDEPFAVDPGSAFTVRYAHRISRSHTQVSIVPE